VHTARFADRFGGEPKAVSIVDDPRWWVDFFFALTMNLRLSSSSKPLR